jgi:hypothetical protein
VTAAFLILLAGAWIAVFLPAIRRARKATPLSTAERWRRRMELIAPRHAASRTRGRWVVVPESRKSLARDSWRRGQRTRRRIFELMIGAVIGSFLAALFWQSDNASLVTYMALLVEAKRRRHQRAIAVRRRGRRPAMRRRPQVVWVAPARPGFNRR